MPWAVGFSILELSKYVMQSLWYKEIRPTFDGKVSTLMSDTDSWILLAKEKSADDMAEKLKHVMDFSNYPSEHKLYNGSRKNKVGF